MIYIKILLFLSIVSYIAHNESTLADAIQVITDCQLTREGDISNKNKDAIDSSNDENIRSRVERLSKEITLANQIGDEEKSLKLACLVLDIFSEMGIIDLLKYGNVDARGNITHIRDFPNEFPIIETTDDQGIYSYEVDEGEIKSMLSNNNQCEYIVILSPWDGYPLFKIKISDDFIFWLTGE